ncbi:flagellar P-ring protein 1 [Iodidimonas gelatinilytica]|uniref:Flagellar P-ring protein n=2 Tax=Iodidimonas gelatinilytica TaxID=1236966 RepID=A0A5A7MZR4_9PROT|nr:flagellar basal body P-ring protein FlgI [Iodidimonas gelatinilytica]GER01493.1 flagellar P-ring protein 1 [Iodidimonas gelatinilytica]
MFTLRTSIISGFTRILALYGLCASLVLSLGVSQPVNAASRLKDLVSVEGVRENQLVGYGLVVGLNGTGDTLRNAPFTQQSIESMLERLGVNTRDAANMVTDNVAAVIVTADLPAFSRPGNRIDVQVSTMGDAEDLRGGVLMVTPLLGADGEVYAVAQGPIAVAGFAATGAAANITQGVPTSGRIASGAIVEREVPFEFASMQQVNLSLKNPDFTTAKRIATTINNAIGSNVAQMIDPSTVQLVRPAGFDAPLIQMVTDVEQLTVEPDTPAKVVIDDRSGIIVMGANVRVSTVAIAQGNLTIRISETPVASQPNPFSDQGDTVVLPRTNIEVDTESENRLALVENSVTLQDLVNGLNALGIGPRDMISILQAIKAAGALQADIEVM